MYNKPSKLFIIQQGWKREQLLITSLAACVYPNPILELITAQRSIFHQDRSYCMAMFLTK